MKKAPINIGASRNRTIASTTTGGLLRSYLEDGTTAVTSESTGLNFSLAARESNTGLLPLQNNIRFSVPSTTTQFNRVVNYKAYELSDHLGNVSVVLSDLKTASWSPTTGALLGNSATRISYSNYYPFGMLTDQAVTPGAYRYGFNGKEKDAEGLGGGGSTYDYGFRIYNPQIAKFLSVDPLTKGYPELTPYQFASNTPIQFIDIDGLEGGSPLPGTGLLTPAQAEDFFITYIKNPIGWVDSKIWGTQNGNHKIASKQPGGSVLEKSDGSRTVDSPSIQSKGNVDYINVNPFSALGVSGAPNGPGPVPISLKPKSFMELAYEAEIAKEVVSNVDQVDNQVKVLENIVPKNTEAPVQQKVTVVKVDGGVGGNSTIRYDTLKTKVEKAPENKEEMKNLPAAPKVKL